MASPFATTQTPCVEGNEPRGRLRVGLSPYTPCPHTPDAEPLNLTPPADLASRPGRPGLAPMSLDQGPYGSTAINQGNAMLPRPSALLRDDRSRDWFGPPAEHRGRHRNGRGIWGSFIGEPQKGSPVNGHEEVIWPHCFPTCGDFPADRACRDTRTIGLASLEPRWICGDFDS